MQIIAHLLHLELLCNLLVDGPEQIRVHFLLYFSLDVEDLDELSKVLQDFGILSQEAIGVDQHDHWRVSWWETEKKKRKFQLKQFCPVLHSCLIYSNVFAFGQIYK